MISCAPGQYTAREQPLPQVERLLGRAEIADLHRRLVRSGMAEFKADLAQVEPLRVVVEP
jgi:hypothetical protein